MTEVQEAVAYLRAVFPSRKLFDAMVAEGARGDETHTITGDDLAGACHSLSVLMEYLGVRYE